MLGSVLSYIPIFSYNHCYFSNLTSIQEKSYCEIKRYIKKALNTSGLIKLLHLKLYMFEIIGVIMGLNLLV